MRIGTQHHRAHHRPEGERITHQDADLAGTSEPRLREVFAEAHTAVPHNIGTWAMQASFADHGDWAGLGAFVKTTQPAPAAKAAAPVKAPAEPDDLTNLQGIGPKAAKALGSAGITTYAALAAAGEPTLRKALHDKDMTAPANIATWPMQADYAVRGDWRGLARYNQRSGAGKAAPKAKAAPAAAPAPAPAAAKPDDLTQLTGIGPRIASLLTEGGVTTFGALQHMSSEELREIDHGRRCAAAVEPRQLADAGVVRGQGRLEGPGRLQQAAQPLRRLRGPVTGERATRREG